MRHGWNAILGALVVVLGLMMAGAGPVGAMETHEDEFGVTNGEELTLDLMLRKLERGELDPMACMYGYWATKSGDHVGARKIFEACAARGVLAAMPWIANLESNGLGGVESPERAAAWDRRAAEQGYSIGELNYGLDLLRGHGVARDEALGRAMIDRAAAQGDASARSVIDSGYDWRAVTPDVDEQHYEKRLY
jgi:hypothetical protein